MLYISNFMLEFNNFIQHQIEKDQHCHYYLCHSIAISDIIDGIRTIKL
jgi:hypothetical protein